MKERNLSMLMDFYELTMANGFLKNGLGEKRVVFDLFFRTIPDDGGYVILAGIKQAIEYIEELKFTKEDIQYLKNKGIFDEEFLKYLENFKFECDVYGMVEGSVVFPHEPLMTIDGPVIQVQLLETMLLLTINHQSLIATKSRRIIESAKGRPVIDFGARRAHSYDAAVIGTRAAYIGGISGTSNVLSDIEYGIPASGTMAHSWIQFFDTEYDAFLTYAKTYPNNSVFLIDTYDTLKSGVLNAIKVAKDYLEPNGYRLKGVRLDSGDLSYLSKQVRKILDESDMKDCKIVVSNSLDEYLIRSLLIQEAPIDIFGVGERLITSKSNPVFGGVYKLVAVDDGENLVPRIKVSENVDKVTNPGFKRVVRFIDKTTGMYVSDVICLFDEVIDKDSYEIFDPKIPYIRKKLENYEIKELTVKIYEKGKLIYNIPTIKETRKYCESEVNKLWEEVKRFENPHGYYVDLSQNLYDLKMELLKKVKK